MVGKVLAMIDWQTPGKILSQHYTTTLGRNSFSEMFVLCHYDKNFICTQCSTMHETFLDLSLPIPEDKVMYFYSIYVTSLLVVSIFLWTEAFNILLSLN